MILVLDNYDSFVHNVARYLRLGGKTTRIVRSDDCSVDQCRKMAPEAIVISPGPHRPEQAGCSLEVVRQLAGEIPILGICLGHQTIAAAYGGEVIVGEPRHGSASEIRHDGTGVFNGLPSRFSVGRYHSLQVKATGLPRSLQVNAWTLPQPADKTTANGRSVDESEVEPAVVMGIADHARCVHGVQFHPESWLTEHGHALLGRFFRLVDQHHRRARRIDHASSQRRPVVWPGHASPIGLAGCDVSLRWPNPSSDLFVHSPMPSAADPSAADPPAAPPAVLEVATRSANWCRSAG